MSSAAPCQEPPPAFAGGPVCARPCAAHSTSAAAAAAAAKVAPETWLESVWAAAGLPDDGAGEEGAAAAAAADQFCSLDFTPQDDSGTGDQLSTQLYRNKQLQDSLLQKEEELVRLQEENSHLRQFLSSALVKQVEQKTKTLLWQSGQKFPRGFWSGKRRRLRAEDPPRLPPPEASRPQKARRNLLAAFSACEEDPPPPNPPVDTWVLQTLGLKDIDTIDESPSANYSALAPGLRPGSFLPGPVGPTDLGVSNGQPAVYECDVLAPRDSVAGTREEPSPYTPLLPPLCCYSLLPQSQARLAPCTLPCCADDPSPSQMEVAFTTSLTPHCNVKTHTFRQGQAFVRREEDGGWKLTWVPRQPE